MPLQLLTGTNDSLDSDTVYQCNAALTYQQVQYIVCVQLRPTLGSGIYIYGLGNLDQHTVCACRIRWRAGMSGGICA